MSIMGQVCPPLSATVSCDVSPSRDAGPTAVSPECERAKVFKSMGKYVHARRAKFDREKSTFQCVDQCYFVNWCINCKVLPTKCQSRYNSKMNCNTVAKNEYN